MNAASASTGPVCPVCGNEIEMGRSQVWVREDGKLAHVKHDPLPAPARPAAAARPAVKPDKAQDKTDGPVGVLRRTASGWSVTVEGVEVFSAPSGTAIGRWKKDHAPDLTLVRDPHVVREETERKADRDRRALNRLSNSKKSRRSGGGTVPWRGTMKRSQDNNEEGAL